jgi:hypothetical protein
VDIRNFSLHFRNSKSYAELRTKKKLWNCHCDPSKLDFGSSAILIFLAETVTPLHHFELYTTTTFTVEIVILLQHFIVIVTALNFISDNCHTEKLFYHTGHQLKATTYLHGRIFSGVTISSRNFDKYFINFGTFTLKFVDLRVADHRKNFSVELQ